MKIVINNNYGGFVLSDDAMDKLKEKGFTEEQIFCLPRHHSALVEVVEELGEDASEHYSELVVVDVDVKDKYYIYEYDGWETVHTEEDIPWVYVNTETNPN